MWTVGAAVTLLIAACGGGEDDWSGAQFRTAAEQQIRRDAGVDEVICETPTPAETGTVFACRAPYTNSGGNVAWDDYAVEIVNSSDFVVTAAGGFVGD